jgi:hypothetical protein
MVELEVDVSFPDGAVERRSFNWPRDDTQVVLPTIVEHDLTGVFGADHRDRLGSARLGLALGLGLARAVLTSRSAARTVTSPRSTASSSSSARSVPRASPTVLVDVAVALDRAAVLVVGGLDPRGLGSPQAAGLAELQGRSFHGSTGASPGYLQEQGRIPGIQRDPRGLCPRLRNLLLVCQTKS